MDWRSRKAKFRQHIGKKRLICELFHQFDVICLTIRQESAFKVFKKIDFFSNNFSGLAINAVEKLHVRTAMLDDKCTIEGKGLQFHTFKCRSCFLRKVIITDYQRMADKVDSIIYFGYRRSTIVRIGLSTFSARCTFLDIRYPPLSSVEVNQFIHVSLNSFCL